MESAPGELTGSIRRTHVAWLIPACVAIITFVSFAPVLQNGFVSWDDDKNFVDNPLYRGLGPAQLSWMWTTFHMGHYVPLSWMTLGLDYLMWGMNPAGYHFTNLLLHTATAVVVYFIARRLLRAALATANGVGPDLASSKPSPTRTTVGASLRIDVAAAFAALVFSVHPLRVESVAWVTERRDVLSGLFYFSSILAYLRWRDRPGTRAGYVAALGLFVAALLSKATAMTLPAVLLIIDVYPLRRLGGSGGWGGPAARKVYVELAPFAALSAGTAALSIIALHPPSQLGFAQKLAVSAYSLMFYIWKTIVPGSLAALYEMPQHVDPLAARYVAGYAFVLLLAVGVWILRKRWLAAAVALVAFVVITLPMLGVVQNGPQIAADRYTYYPAPALAILAASMLFLAGPRVLTPATRVSVAAAVVIALSALTWTQAGVWKDSKTLWTQVLAVDSMSSIAHSAMANVMYKENRVADGVDHSRRAIEIAPGYPEAHNGMGVGLVRQGRIAEAIAEYDTALSLNPNYDDAENDLGIALAESGKPADAIAHYARALELNPNNSNAQVNWGNALVRLNRPDEAIEHYAAALRLQPRNAEAHHNWGVALARQGRYDAAIEHFQAALALDPTHVEARDYLAKATALLRQQESARQKP